MTVHIGDDREYAWLLVRSDTFTVMLVEGWELVPVRAGDSAGLELAPSGPLWSTGRHGD